MYKLNSDTYLRAQMTEIPPKANQDKNSAKITDIAIDRLSHIDWFTKTDLAIKNCSIFTAIVGTLAVILLFPLILVISAISLLSCNPLVPFHAAGVLLFWIFGLSIYAQDCISGKASQYIQAEKTQRINAAVTRQQQPVQERSNAQLNRPQQPVAQTRASQHPNNPRVGGSANSRTNVVHNALRRSPEAVQQVKNLERALISYARLYSDIKKNPQSDPKIAISKLNKALKTITKLRNDLIHAALKNTNGLSYYYVADQIDQLQKNWRVDLFKEHNSLMEILQVREALSKCSNEYVHLGKALKNYRDVQKEEMENPSLNYEIAIQKLNNAHNTILRCRRELIQKVQDITGLDYVAVEKQLKDVLSVDWLDNLNKEHEKWEDSQHWEHMRTQRMEMSKNSGEA